LKVIGIDLGGTNYAVGLVDETGNILSRIEGKTKVDEGPQAVAKKAFGICKVCHVKYRCFSSSYRDWVTGEYRS
jgi:glucokinase (EC 2.7.1.2)